MDWETFQAMMRYGLLNGVDPFAIDPAQDIAVPFIPPSDPDDAGTQDYFNQRLTMEKKANDYFMDPATTIRLGLSTGGISPESVSPNVTYEPVQMGAAPGAVLESYAKSGDPIQEITALVLSDGGNRNTAEMEIRKLIADPNTSVYADWYDRVVTDPRVYYDDNGEQVVDSRAIADIAKYVEDDYKNTVTGSPSVGGSGGSLKGGVPFDTSGAGFTDGTVVGTEDGGTYVQGADGNWYIRREEKSDTTQALEEAGFEGDPYRTYDPEMLVSKPVAAQRDRVNLMAERQSPEALNKQMREAMHQLTMAQNYDPANILGPPLPTGQAQPSRGTQGGESTNIFDQAGNAIEGIFDPNKPGPDINMPSIEGTARRIEGIFDPNKRTRKTTGSLGPELQAMLQSQSGFGLPGLSTPRNQTRPSRAATQGAEQARRNEMAAQRKINLTKRQQTARQQDQEMLRRRETNRMAAMQMLADLGHSPFQDWNRARQANIYGG